MAITRVSQSTVKEGLEKANNFLAGFAPLGMEYDSIQTVTVGAGGASSIDFTSIPQTYQHLQVRIIGRALSGVGGEATLRLNGDSGSNYAWHSLIGNGSSAAAYAGTATATAKSGCWLAGSGTTQMGASIVDILDYTSTGKNTVSRTLTGMDANGSGEIQMFSTLWVNTAAVTALSFVPFSTTGFAQFSSFALYGIKAPAV